MLDFKMSLLFYGIEFHNVSFPKPTPITCFWFKKNILQLFSSYQLTIKRTAKTKQELFATNLLSTQIHYFVKKNIFFFIITKRTNKTTFIGQQAQQIHYFVKKNIFFFVSRMLVRSTWAWRRPLPSSPRPASSTSTWRRGRQPDDWLQTW